MRAVLILGLLVALSIAADAAPAHHAKLRTVHMRAPQRALVDPGPGVTPSVTPPARFAVPGWTDEETRQWLDNANSCSSCGG
jgi:hypothetical protein